MTEFTLEIVETSAGPGHAIQRGKVAFWARIRRDGNPWAGNRFTGSLEKREMVIARAKCWGENRLAKCLKTGR